MADYRLYQVKVTLLSPLHIGSGRELLHEYDYAIYQGRTWRINEDALLDTQEVDDPDLVDRLMHMRPAELLNPPDFREGSSLFRYAIGGVPRSQAEGAQVREQLKDGHDRPYLPGTSLKGALRTALAWAAWGKQGLRPERARLDRRSRFAAQWYEQELFSMHGGKAPNHDLLRALQVGDSMPVSPEMLMLINARVLNRAGGLGSPIELEAIKPETVFTLTAKVDTVLFSAWAQRGGLRLKHGDLLRDWPSVVQQHTMQRLEHEAEWFARIPGTERVADFCRRLVQTSLPDTACLLQLGWGTGWEGKTFGSHLQADQDFMESIVCSSNQGGYGLARGRRQPGDPFPKSRRVLVQVQRAPDGSMHEIPIAPPGWVLLELQPEAGQVAVTSISVQGAMAAVPALGLVEPVTPPPEPVPPPEGEPSPPEMEPEQPQAAPVEPGPPLLPGPGTGVVTWYNMKQGLGRVQIDGSQEEVQVQRTHLRQGERFLVPGSRVAFTLVQDEGGFHLEGVGPV